MSFYSKITLTNNSKYYLQELKVKHLKTIFKCLLGDEPDVDVLFFNLNVILKELISLDVNKLNFIDYFLILINTRCFAIGSNVNIQISENVTGSIDCSQVANILQNLNFKQTLESTILEDVVINYKLPTINELILLNKQNSEESYGYFLHSLKIKSEEIVFSDIKQTNLIFNKLPPKVGTVVINKIKTIVNYFNSIDLLSYNTHLNKVNLYFNFNIKNLCMLLKLLFGDQLLSLYENMFALSKMANISMEYIENCTPGEYLVFVKKLEEINKGNNSSSTPNQENFTEDPIDPYESLNPYESGDLPPITSEFTG